MIGSTSSPSQDARPADGGVLLGIDTAGTVALVALAAGDGSLLALDAWPAGYRHGEELLTRLDALLTRSGCALSMVSGIVVGTGPGAFTGLRVGLATAKALAHGLGLPIVGVATSSALLAAAADRQGDSVVGRPGAVGREDPPAFALLLPAGPSDRVVVCGGEAPRLVPGGTEPDLPAGTMIVAVDLDGRASPDAVARGKIARDGFAAALMRRGAERLDCDDADDLALLVPEYVTLPRGVRATAGEVQWSLDLR